MTTEIIVASDSHGRGDLLRKLEQAYPNARLFLHCGDLEEDASLYPRWTFVRGNNDWYGSQPDTRVITMDGHRIYMTHSHLFGYQKRLERMAQTAKENDCDILLYGHTHRADVEEVNGVWTINPGSIWYPRDGNPPSFARILLEEGKEPEVQIIYENNWPFSSKRPDERKRRRRWF